MYAGSIEKNKLSVGKVFYADYLISGCIGFFETAAIFSPTTTFRSVDLPTLGLPIIEIKPERKSSCVLTVCSIYSITFNIDSCNTIDNFYYNVNIFGLCLTANKRGRSPADETYRSRDRKRHSNGTK